jgi:hypothetical protein
MHNHGAIIAMAVVKVLMIRNGGKKTHPKIHSHIGANVMLSLKENPQMIRK